MAYAADPPVPLSHRLGSEFDRVLSEAVNPEAWSLITAIQRASRYANVNKAGEPPRVNYTRRVLTLGIVETALFELSADPATKWVGDWLLRLDPNVSNILEKNDRSRAVSERLKINRRIIVRPKLGKAVDRARDIAKATMGSNRIDLRHLVYAISENPGRAFHNFERKPSKADLAELRRLIVDNVERSPEPNENVGSWRRLLEQSEQSTSMPDDEIDSDTDEDIDDEAVNGLDDAISKEAIAPDGDEGLAGKGEAVTPEQPSDETATDFVLDDAELDQDQLERAILAIGLGRRLHMVWRQSNEQPASSVDRRGAHEGSRAAFVVHLDAPWGGGKTTFANFLGAVLNPTPKGSRPARFLTERYGEADLGGIFLEDPPLSAADAAALKAKYKRAVRRPWVIVYFNAWQMEHIRPPWWAFYQVIRKSCFDAVRDEGSRDWDPTTPRGKRAVSWITRWDQWLSLWAKEFVWRATNPKISLLLLTAAICAAIVIALRLFGWWGVIQTDDGASAGFLLGNPVGLVLTGIGGITGLWALAALLTESIVPGSDSLAERLNLGSGDPFGRFRRHFARTMKRIRRPVLVVVDDLDRCEPEFVVDLIRGVQTLLRSPRVVFVILGDRDWIERAFEAKHAAMNKVDVGPEQTFGARFVEKAIQMSFILPAPADSTRLSYVRHVVLGNRASRGMAKPAGLSDEAAARLRDFVNSEAALATVDSFDSAPILESVRQRLWSQPLGEDESEGFGENLEKAGVDSSDLAQFISDTLAVRTASDADAERAVKHELEAFAPFFPANPRQVKRIINAVTIYYAVAIQRPGISPDREFRTQLAAWVIIMTEWPQTWRLLASFPDLVTALTAADPFAEIKAGKLGMPGSPDASAKMIKPILADPELMALITARGLEDRHWAFTAERVRQLAELTPLHSRMRRVEEDS